MDEDNKQPFLNIPLDEEEDRMVKDLQIAFGGSSRAAVGRMALRKLYDEFTHVQKVKKVVQPKIRQVSKS